MNPFLRKMFGATIASAVAALAVTPSAGAATSQPLYNNTRPLERRPVLTNLDAVINLIDRTGAAPATTVEEANSRFSARAAEAIRWTVDQRDNLLRVPNNSDNPASLVGKITGCYNEQNFGFTILAMMAYKDYFDKDAVGDQLRADVYQMLLSESAGIIGTSPDFSKFGIQLLKWHGEYDVLLQAYIALYYKYYEVLPQNVRDKLINELLSVSGPGPTWGAYLSPVIMQALLTVGSVVQIPESENHVFMIESARYLINQVLYQQTHNTGRFDNNRNGDGKNRPPLVDYILSLLQGRLKYDFNEYNSRPYQNYTMVAILNLATYAYDDRVRLAAQMVLDYVSAKVAVSSVDLRRSTPYRRRNELQFYGPRETTFDRYLATSLLGSDPQTAFYSLLAGNTGAWGRRADGATAAYAMVHAGTRDYRVPPSILDLFVTPAHRRFYQRFHHNAYTIGGDTGQYADELYAGSPNYLISAGGHATYYSSVAMQLVGIDSGDDADRGLAVPTTFITSYAGQLWGSLADMIQSGIVSPDITTASHLGVAPDFLCGDDTYFPYAFSYSQASGSYPEQWAFLKPNPGCYAAIYRFSFSGRGPQTPAPTTGNGVFMEAFDTSLHPGVSFDDFAATVWAKNGTNTFQFPGQNTYETYAGQRIQFYIAPGIGDIISTTDVTAPAGYKDKFAYGTIVNSEQGSALITLTNPALGTQIILDMHDQDLKGDPRYGMHHPRRTAESGAVQSAGGNEELWVDFNSPANLPEDGDFYHPYKSLTAARDNVAAGGTINLVPGTKVEPITITKPMTLRSFPGSATISSH